ncbi:MAG: DUF4339 domain-containing protein [Neisseriaceae bacterium]|nr:DUF4339 domain-containing protein [Neisseriaceae bacterium]
MSNENKWFYAVNDEQKDAVSTEELYNLFKQGVINDKSLVWQEGMADWLELSQVETLQTAFTALKNQENQTQNKPDEWFYVLNEQRHGAVGADEIRALIKNGTLNSDSLVWQQGQAEWVALRYCREFAETLSTVPPKIPPQNTPQAVVQPNNKNNDKTILYIAYACFLCSIILSPLTLIAAEIIAYVADDGWRPALHKSHFEYIRKHSWIALFLGILGFITMFIFIGILILIADVIYILAIGITGLMRLQEDRPPQKNPLQSVM